MINKIRLNEYPANHDPELELASPNNCKIYMNMEIIST
jgi:hypothetical protein